MPGASELSPAAPPLPAGPQPLPFSLTQVFNAPIEEVVLAMWRHYAQTVRELPRPLARLDPAPQGGIQCLNLPVELCDWPAETPGWAAERWRSWRAHHSWVVAAGEMLWGFMSVDGGGEIRGSTRYVPSRQPHQTLRHLQATLFLDPAEEPLALLAAQALRHYFEKEHAGIRRMLHRADP